MSGHSHWSGIKHKKETTDKKRGALFSKLLNVVTVTAKKEPNPQFNPTLRSAIDKAKQNNVPQDNIGKAITDSKNRAVAETKKILSDHEAKWADPGSVLWAFEKTAEGWQGKFKHEITPGGKEKLKTLIEELENHNDIQRITTNTNL